LNSILRRRQASKTEYSITGFPCNFHSFIHSFPIWDSVSYHVTTLSFHHFVISLHLHHLQALMVYRPHHTCFVALVSYASSSWLLGPALIHLPPSPSYTSYTPCSTLYFYLVYHPLSSNILLLLFACFSIPFSLAPSLHLCAPSLLHSCTLDVHPCAMSRNCLHRLRITIYHYLLLVLVSPHYNPLVSSGFFWFLS
jgi:hypothetical protein